MTDTNLADFCWNLVNYITQNRDQILFVSDETYSERINLCKGCEKFNELENMCEECGCYVPSKAKIILESCPLKTWDVDRDAWYERFNKIKEDIDNPSKSL